MVRVRTRIVQAYRRDGKPAGLYRVPVNISDEEFRKEFFRFNQPAHFDNNNMIDAKRIYKPVKQTSGLWYPQWRS